MPRVAAPLRLAIARALESGRWNGPLARAASHAWAAVASRSVARPLVFPDHAGARLVAIGGPTLGGSGKTPLSIACTRALGASGARVALIGHGYRAHARGAHVVSAHQASPRALASALATSGDEAILAARACAGFATVVVAGTRQAALDHAATFADVLVVDGVLQTSPRRASLSLLAVDAEAPWGAGASASRGGAVPPRGDLRAPKRALLASTDAVVPIHDPLAHALPSSPAALFASIDSPGAHVFASTSAPVLLPWSDLAALRVGLFVALARPARLTRFLALRGVTPAYIHAEPDHAPGGPALHRALSRSLAQNPVDLWLATPKCALQLEAAAVPHAVIAHSLGLSAGLCATLQVLLTPLDSGRYSTFVRDLPRI